MKKIASIGLSITTAVWLSGMTFVVPAYAQTAADIQSQINALLSQIQSLQSQLGTSGGGTSMMTSYNYTRNLTVGSRGADVTALQDFLMSQTSANWPSGQAATGYFGSITKSALARYQAAAGISPAAGYFGPKTRAYVASVAVGGGTTGGGTTGGGTTGGGVVVAPSTGLAVSLSVSNPPSGSLISSGSSAAARVPVLAVNFTAGTSGAATVNELKFHKTGVLSDTAISSAYLIESGKVLQQYSSLSQGVIDFANMNMSVNAGQTRTLWLAIDPSTGLSAGNTVGFAITSASDVMSVDYNNTAVTATGNFPLSGNIFTVTSVSNPAIASVSVTSTSVGNSVYAGTPGVLVSQWTVTTNNSPVNLTSINFKVVGSATKTDIRNVKLLVNGTQVGQTLTTVGSDGSAYFDLTSAPARLQTGSSNLQVMADIMGSPSFDFAFELLNSYDVYAVDSQYQVPVSVAINAGAGIKVTINQGAITLTAATDTPSGNIAKGSSGVTLGKFNLYAAGEPVKVKFLDIKFTTDTSANNASTSLQNIYLVDDQGIQIGTTINTIAAGSSSGQCADTQTGTTLSGSTASMFCHFGTSSSNINYIAAANTTRVISVKSDILSTATTWSTLTVSLPGNTSNLQGQTSSQTANSGGATGAALTLANNPLLATKNTAFGNQTYAKGATGAKIGSFVLTASAAEGVNVSNLTIAMTASSTQLQNLLVKVNGVQFGNNKSTLAGSDTVSFAGSSPISIASGGSVAVDVFADLLSSANTGTYTTLTSLSSCTGTGASTYSAVSCSPTNVSGQSPVVSSGPSMSINISSNTAPTKQVVMGSTNNSLATFRFTDTANIEPIKVNKLIFVASSSPVAGATTTVPSFANVGVYSGGTMIGGPVSASTTGIGTFYYIFNFNSPPSVPQNGSLELELRGDVASFISNGALSNAPYAFLFDSTTTDITALGQSSNSSVTGASLTKGTPVGNFITVLRTKLTLSSATLGTTSNRVRTAVDDLANLVFSADTGYDATVNTVTVKFQGQAVSTAGSATFGVDLIDSQTGTDWSGSSVQTCNPAAGGTTCVVSFGFSPAPVISAGTSKTVKVRINSSGLGNVSQQTDSLSVLIPATNSVNWGDGSTTNGLTLQATDVPITITTVSYE